MRQRMTSRKGFTLVELMIAVVILAIGLLGLAQLQVTAMQATTHSSGMVGANALAQRVAEEIMSFPPDPEEITTVGGQPFLSTAAANALLIYNDSRSDVVVDHSNVLIAGSGAGRYQVTYTTNPDYTGMAALGDPIRVCRIDIRVTDLSETRARNFLDLTIFKNWTP